jgi:hypothetical protein
MGAHERLEDSKLKELILYVAQKSADDPRFGATKLNKILFFSDFLAYGELGRPITGVRYQRLDHGPAPVRLLPAQRELETEGAVQLVEVAHYTWTQKRLTPTRRADLSTFSATEIAVVDEVVDWLREFSATEVSALSHLERSWQIVADREEIPYEYVFLSNEPLTPADERRGREIAAIIDGGTTP